jgi:hypothetical protein
LKIGTGSRFLGPKKAKSPAAKSGWEDFDDTEKSAHLDRCDAGSVFGVPGRVFRCLVRPVLVGFFWRA